MKRLILLFISFLNLHHADALAQIKHCHFDESQAVTYTTSDLEVLSLLSQVVEIARKNPMNGNQFSDFEKLITSNKNNENSNFIEATISMQSLPQCPEPLAFADNSLSVGAGKKLLLKNFAFQMTYSFEVDVLKSEKGLGSMSLNKVISLTGNILIDAQCDSPLKCNNLVQVYTKDIKSYIYRIGTVGGSTSAGGIIIQFL